jgi:hypothetical protein
MEQETWKTGVDEKKALKKYRMKGQSGFNGSG